MQPSEVAALLHYAAQTLEDSPYVTDKLAREGLVTLADSFDQPGDGPLAYSESEGRMVRLEQANVLDPSETHQQLTDGRLWWRFPEGEAE